MAFPHRRSRRRWSKCAKPQRRRTRPAPLMGARRLSPAPPLRQARLLPPPTRPARRPLRHQHRHLWTWMMMTTQSFVWYAATHALRCVSVSAVCERAWSSRSCCCAAGDDDVAHGRQRWRPCAGPGSSGCRRTCTGSRGSCYHRLDARCSSGSGIGSSRRRCGCRRCYGHGRCWRGDVGGLRDVDA